MTGSKGTKGTKVGGVGSTPRHGLSIPSPLPGDLEALVFRVIGAAMKVHTRLGPGLPEGFYRDALVVELESVGLRCETERAASTTYHGRQLRRHRLDLVVEGRMVVECKAVTRFAPVRSSQLIPYLRATGIKVGVLLNFNEAHLRDGIRRHVL
jgi:GxxExxY protein